jgi:Protein of unknown function (DUF664)
VITRDDYLYFAVRALRGMGAIVSGLGDDLANRAPDLPGANSPYALLHHCLGVVEYWAGELVGGRPSRPRDRAAEFTATGPVGPLLLRAAEVTRRYREDVTAARPGEPPHGAPPADFHGPDRELDQGGVLLHVYEELAQHHGQMEVLRDVLLAEHGTGAA